MTAEDHRDYESIKKLLDRLGKAVIMSAETDHRRDHPPPTFRLGRPAG